MENVYDPALIQMLTQLGSMPERQDLMRTQMQYGRDDSQTPMPAGMRVGGTYIASSPLEHLAAALKQGIGGYRQGQATQGLQQSFGQQDQARNQYGNEVLRMLQQMAAQRGGGSSWEEP